MATLCDTRSISPANYSEYDEEWLNRMLVPIQTANKRDTGSEVFKKSCHPECEATFPLESNDATFSFLKTLGTDVCQSLVYPKKPFTSGRFGAEETYAFKVEITPKTLHFMRQINLARLDLEEEEVLDWDFTSIFPPPKQSIQIKVKFKELGRSKPILNLDPFE